MIRKIVMICILAIDLLIPFYTQQPNYAEPTPLYEAYLPVVVQNIPVTVYPIPGEYNLNQYMGISVDWKGCDYVAPEFVTSNQLGSFPYMVYNQDCIDGKTTLMVSFYEPVDITNLSIYIYANGTPTEIPVWGHWKFGK